MLLRLVSPLSKKITIRTLSSKINGPSPPPLPMEQQREFQELLRKAQTPLASDAIDVLDMHPDARIPIKPEFDGDVNPTTGEQNGPKHEPVHCWSADPGGDWSFKGRVSDF